MKKVLLSIALITAFVLPSLDNAVGGPSASRDSKVNKADRDTELVPEPACVPSAEHSKINIFSWDSVQKASKIVGALQQCVTTQQDVLRLLSGPNFIGLSYPEEKEKWGYLWLWSSRIRSPVGESLIFMDEEGKRIRKGKDSVELFIVFNDRDIVESVEFTLLKKPYWD